MSDAITIKCDTNSVSDGYHTFGELYEHRIELWIALCRMLTSSFEPALKHLVWKSRYHSDGSKFDGWFILGFRQGSGLQITYHLPNKYWDRTEFAIIRERAPTWDGHTAADVLERLKTL